MTQVKPTWKSRLKSLLVCLAILCAIVWFLDRSINPHNMNHLILIREVPDAESIPDRAVLIGDVNWEQAFDFYGGGRVNSLTVANIAHPWNRGTLSIYERDGDLLASVKLRPPGRYCGGLVILLTEEGETLTAWNQLPVKHEEGRGARQGNFIK